MAKRNGVLLILLLALTIPATASASAPNIGGQWQYLPPVPAGFNAVHLIASPTGKILLIAGSGRNKANFQAGTFTSFVWEQGSPNPWRKVPVTPGDMFCAGHVLLPDGRALVVGGTENFNPDKPNTFNAFSPPFGSRKVYAFNFQTERYQTLAPMEIPRWYPTAVTIGDGRVVIASGKDQNGQTTAVNEIFNPATNQTNRLPGTRLFPTYPDMHLAGTGELFYSGTATGTTGTPAPGFWSPLTNAYRPVGGLRNPAGRRLGAACFIGDARQQQLMVIGGGGSRATDVIDLDTPSPRYVPGPPLGAAKSYLNCSNLPDGSVLEAGGGTSNDVVNASREVGLLRSVQGPWQQMNPLPAGEHRLYHSLLCVLDSGQVLSLTSNPGEGANPSSQSRSMLLWSPPYLFKGPRPRITAAPTRVRYGGRYAVRTSVPSAAMKVTTYPSVTHSEDTNQRYLSLPMTNGTITMPDRPSVMPPGWYRLWAVDGQGRPSTAWPIHLGA